MDKSFWDLTEKKAKEDVFLFFFLFDFFKSEN